jgi:hypothetical protein
VTCKLIKEADDAPSKRGRKPYDKGLPQERGKACGKNRKKAGFSSGRLSGGRLSAWQAGSACQAGSAWQAGCGWQAGLQAAGRNVRF